MRKGIIVSAVVLAAISALVGCGGGDSSVSAADYSNELRLACNKGEREIEELVGRISENYYEKREQAPTTKFQVENLLKVISAYDDVTGEIADIGIPEEGNQQKQAEELVKTREEAVAKVEASPLGTRDSIPQIFKSANELAEDLGASTCMM